MDSHVIPTYSLQKGDKLESPFRAVEMTLLKEGNYDYSHPHRHDYYEVFFFETGSGKHDIDFNTFNIESPCLHFVSPGQVHQVQRGPESFGQVLLFTADFYYLHLANKDFLHELPFLNGNTIRPILNLAAHEAQEITDIIKQICKEYKEQNLYREEIIRSTLNLLLLTARRLFESRGETQAEETMESRLVRNLRRLVDSSFHSMHAVSAYANALHVTPGHLNDVTKQETGKTVSTLIQERIVLEAKRMLVHSDQSVKEIAYALGFDDPSYFTRFFRERAEEAPNTFRENQKKSLPHHP